MRRRVIFLALMAGCFSPLTAAAQQSPAPVLNAPKTVSFRYIASETVVDAKATWEDVEIFRRLLDRSVMGWVTRSHAEGSLSSLEYSPGGKRLAVTADGTVKIGEGSWANQLIGHAPDAGHAAVEGNYLKGYGVVFTATLPWDGRSPVAEPAKSEPKALSDWDRVRKEIRGEKAETEPGKGQPSPSLADVVSKILADNGRHFTQLGDNERVTVAITLRPPPSAIESIFYPNFIGELVSPPVDIFASVLQQPPQPNQPGEAQGVEATNLVHLGDQRMKQGRHQEAGDAYEKAITLYRKLMEQKKKPGTRPRDLMDYLASLTAVRTKLAQVYYSRGKDREAAQILEAVAKDYEALTRNPSPRAPATPARKPHTGKLIISAPKHLLDQVGSGRVSLEEFKKQVTLDFYSWDGPGKEPANPARGKSVVPAEGKR